MELVHNESQNKQQRNTNPHDTQRVVNNRSLWIHPVKEKIVSKPLMS